MSLWKDTSGAGTTDTTAWFSVAKSSGIYYTNNRQDTLWISETITPPDTAWVYTDSLYSGATQAALLPGWATVVIAVVVFVLIAWHYARGSVRS